MAATTITVTSLSGGNFQDLREEWSDSLHKIDEIKAEVGEEWDNLSNPVPFITQVPVLEMTGDGS